MGGPSTSLRAGGPPAGETEDTAAATARSGVLGAAIQARLDRGDTEGANALLTQVQDQLDPAHAGPLQGQIATAQRFDAANAYADQFTPSAPSSSAEEIEAQRDAALRQAALDHAEDAQQQALAGHFINQRFNDHLKDGWEKTMELTGELKDWLSKATRGELERKLPMPALWNRLNPEEQVQLLKQLDQNGRLDGANAGGGIAPVTESLRGRPEDGAATPSTPGTDQLDPQQAALLQGQIQANPAGGSAITPVRYGSDEFTPTPPILGSQPQQTRPPLIPPAQYSLPKDNKAADEPSRPVSPSFATNDIADELEPKLPVTQPAEIREPVPPPPGSFEELQQRRRGYPTEAKEPINHSPILTKLSKEFSPDRPNYHKFEFKDPLCDLGSPGCTVAAAYDALLRYAVPGGPHPGTPLDDREVSSISLAGIGGGHIQSRVEPDSASVIHRTKLDHVFKDGLIQRQIVIQGDTVYVKTYGIGDNDTQQIAAANAALARPAFAAATANMHRLLNPQPQMPTDAPIE